jgi:ArsR family transcriptional regulator
MNKNIDILKSLSDETRFDIIKFLIGGERCVCEIVPKVNKTQSTVSIHLNKLESNGIVESRKEGKYVYYKIANKKYVQLIKLLEKI